MKGLCHDCLTTNVDLFITKGKIQCESCKNAPEKEKEKIKEEIRLLDFEDLPQATEQERLNYLEANSADVMERIFIRNFKNDRVSEPLIDRIHDT